MFEDTDLAYGELTHLTARTREKSSFSGMCCVKRESAVVI